MSSQMQRAASPSTSDRNYNSTESPRPQTELRMEVSTVPAEHMPLTCEDVKYAVLTGAYNYEELQEIATAARTKAHGLKREAIEREKSDELIVQGKNSCTQVTKTLLRIRRGNEVFSLIFKGYATTGEEKRYWSKPSEDRKTSQSLGPDTEEIRKSLGLTDYPNLPPPLKAPVRGKYKTKRVAASVDLP